MINIQDKKDCCGCTACASICPKGAISMEPDALGFMYPKVDVSLCIECSLCDNVCAFNEKYEKFSDFPDPIPYGVRHRDIGTLMASQSGGAFTALSDVVLDRGGIVYGAGWSDDFVVIHKRAETKEQRNALRGSKYVQSDLRDIFAQVKQDLKEGREVLFSGTPCQVAGLKSFVGKNRSERLITVDIICHGVPSPFIFKDYLHYLTKQYGNSNKPTKIVFRDKKKFGHQMYGESYYWGNRSHTDIDYSYMFGKDLMLRHSCANCHYCNLYRSGDVSIGDLWGWSKIDKTLNSDDKGISLVLINSFVGQNLFDTSRKNLDIVEPRLIDCMQSHLIRPSKMNINREAFEKTYIEQGFDVVYSIYGRPNILYLIKRQIRLIYNGFKHILNK